MRKNKLHILFLNYEFPPLGGGAGNATKYLFSEFAKRDGLEIDLITSSTDKFKIEKFAKNICVHYLDIGKKGNVHYQSNRDLLKYSWKAYFYGKSLIKKKKFNLIHAFFGIPCGYIAMRLGLPYIVSLRGSDVPFYNSRFAKLDKLVFYRLSRRIWRRARAVIANSEDLKRLAVKTFSGEIGVIPNGINTSEFKPSKRKIISKKIKLISTGRLITRKGYQYLIPALKGLKNIELTLVGGGDLRNELEELAKKNKVEVNFIGEVGHNEIVNYLQNADIFILPSLNEGMSNSILEAMACGLPIITTDTGGSKKLIDGNGFVIKKRSNSAIKKALLRYQRSKKLILEHGGKSRWIALKFSWSNVADNYNKIYNQLVRPESIYYNNVTRNINSKIIQQWRTRQDSLISYLKSLPKRGTIKIIEFGSGRGFLVEELSTLGFNITGSDFNPLNLKLSKEINGVMLKKIDAENIKLSRNYYDIAVSVELIEHLTDVKMHIGQVRRILKPGGIYFISTPNILIEKIFNFLKRNRAGDRLHISSQSHKSLKKLLEEENFIITYLKMKDLTVGQKDKLNIFRMLYPVKILPKWLQPSIICVAKLKK